MPFRFRELGWGLREGAKIKIWVYNRIPEPQKAVCRELLARPFTVHPPSLLLKPRPRPVRWETRDASAKMDPIRRTPPYPRS